MTHDGLIKLSKFPPPTGMLGPHARRTASHVYQIFDAQGAKLLGGTCGADTEHARAYARNLAARKGITNPELVFIEYA